MSETFMPFPQDKREALERAQAEKLRRTMPAAKQPAPPGTRQPMMQPVSDQQHQQAVQQQAQQRPPETRPGVIVHPPVQSTEFDWLNKPVVQHVPPQMAVPSAMPMPMAAHTQPLDQVPNVTPGFVAALADGENTSVALPSRFAFYKFKDLYVRPFLARHIAKLQKAHREQSLQPIVEAVSSVCYTSDPAYAGRAMGFELTLPDFFFVLYWLRLNSFTKSNYVHTTWCKDKNHRARVEAGELPEESLKLQQVITQTTMQVNELETVPDPEIYHFSETSEMIFRPPTMSDVLEYAEHPKMVTDEREEFAFLAQLASHIQHQSLELKLDQRIQVVENATGDQVELINAYEKALGNYGVVEKVKLTCKECGAVSESQLSLAAHSFFPSE